MSSFDDPYLIKAIHIFFSNRGSGLYNTSTWYQNYIKLNFTYYDKVSVKFFYFNPLTAAINLDFKIVQS